MYNQKFESEHLTFELVQEDDLESLRKIHNDPDTLYWLTDNRPVSVEQQQLWYKRVKVRNDVKYLTVKNKDGFIIGIAKLTCIDYANSSCMIGGDIHPLYRDKGYGTEMFKWMINTVFNELGFHRVWLFTMSTNSRALHVYKKLGMQLEGTLKDSLFRDGVFVDQYVLGLCKDQ